MQCEHENLRNFDLYIKCNNCSMIKTRDIKLWKDARNKWFKSFFYAEYYRTTGSRLDKDIGGAG